MAILRHLCGRDTPAPTVYIYCEPDDHKAWFAPLFEDVTTAIACNVSWQDPKTPFDPGQVPVDTDFVAAVVTTRQLAGNLSGIDALVKAAASRQLPLLYIVMDDKTGRTFPARDGELPFLRRDFTLTAGLVYDQKLKYILTAALTRQPCREAVRRYLAGDEKAAADIYETVGDDPRLLLSLGCYTEANLLLTSLLDKFPPHTVTRERLELELLAADLAYRMQNKGLAAAKFLKIFAMSTKFEDVPPACHSRYFIGLWLTHRDNPPETSEKYCRRAVHRLQLDVIHPDWPRMKEMLIHAKLDAAAIYEKDPATHARAKRVYRQTASRQDRLLKDDHTAKNWLRLLEILRRHRDFLLTLGEHREARSLLSELAFAEHTLSEDFGITDWTYSRMLVREYEQLGDFCLLGQEFEEAQEQYQRAYDSAQKIFRSTGTDEDRMLCSVMSNSLGICFLNEGLTDEAEEAYLRALTLVRRLSDYPEQKEFLRNLCDVAGNLADLYEQTHRPSQAAEHYETCLDAMGQLAEMVRSPGQYRELAQWHLDYSHFLDKLGRRTEAMLHHAKASALEKRAENL